MTEHDNSGQVPALAKLSLRRRFLSLPTLISLVVAFLVLYFLLRRLDVDMPALGRLLRESDPFFVLLAFVVYYSTFPLRGLRWYLLLRRSNKAEPGMKLPSYWQLGGMVLLGWFGNCISWVRLGDAYRGYLVAEHSKVGFSRSMGTIVAERAFDVPVIFMLLLASIAGIWGTHPGSSVMAFIWVGLALITLLVAGLVVMRLLHGSLSRRLPSRLQGVYLRFQEGLVGCVKAVPVVAPLTVVIWLIEATSLYLITLALGIQVTFVFAIFAYLGSSLLYSIPLTPGGLGIVEVGMTGLLSLRMSQEAALSTTLLVRAVTYVSILVVGGIVFTVYQIRRRRSGLQANQPRPRLSTERS